MTLTLNVTKTELENRIHSALEQAMKSPIVKKRKKIINAAMVQILHGGNSSGQNEHNLDQFFTNEANKQESETLFIGELNWTNPLSEEHEIKTFPKDTYKNSRIRICSYIMKYCISLDIDYEELSAFFQSRNIFNFPKNWVLNIWGANSLRDKNISNHVFIEGIIKESSTIQKTFIDFLFHNNYYEGQFKITNISDVKKVKWFGYENFSVAGDGYNEYIPKVISDENENVVKRSIITSSIEFLADYLASSFNLETFFSYLEALNLTITDDEKSMTINEESEEKEYSFLLLSSNLALEKQEALLNHLETFDDVSGGWTIYSEVVEEKETEKKTEKKTVFALDEGFQLKTNVLKEITIFTTLVSHFEFNEKGTGMNFQSVDCLNDLSDKEHESRLKSLFQKYCPDNHTSVEILKEIAEVQNAMEENEDLYEEFDHFETLMNFIIKKCNGTDLVEMLDELTMGTVVVEYSFETKKVY